MTVYFNDGSKKTIEYCNHINYDKESNCMYFNCKKGESWVMLAVIPENSIKYIENDRTDLRDIIDELMNSEEPVEAKVEEEGE